MVHELTPENFFERNYNKHPPILYELELILTPKFNVAAHLGTEGTERLVELVMALYKKEDLSTWAHKELKGALNSTKHIGPVGSITYQRGTWDLGYFSYPYQYKKLFNFLLTPDELEEANNLFKFSDLALEKP